MAEQSTGDTRALAESINILRRLRGPDGCPWDREQTFESVKPHTLEETYEVFDAIDRRAWNDLRDELGDLLLQVLFYAQMADEAGLFNIEDVVTALNAKLIRRHPHVFGDGRASTPAEVKTSWDAIKQREKQADASSQSSFLDKVPHYLPALLEAQKLGRRAAEVNFDWRDRLELIAKLTEETEELRVELDRETLNHEAAAAELGDIFFTAVNLSRHLDLEPEFVLRSANRKFRTRFHHMEVAAGIDNLRACTSGELEQLWKAAKETLATRDLADGSPAATESHLDKTSAESA